MGGTKLTCTIVVGVGREPSEEVEDEGVHSDFRTLTVNETKNGSMYLYILLYLEFQLNLLGHFNSNCSGLA